MTQVVVRAEDYCMEFPLTQEDVVCVHIEARLTV